MLKIRPVNQTLKSRSERVHPKQADRLLKQLPLSERKRQQEIRRLILLDMQQGRVRL